jgi:preprotein translocase subunit SecD
LLASSNLELRAVAGDARSTVFESPEAAERSALFDSGAHEVLPFLDVGSHMEPGTGRYLIVEKRVVLSDEDLSDAYAAPEEYDDSNYMIDFTLSDSAADRFGRWTATHIGTDLAIILNGHIYSAPRIQGEISGSGQFTGEFKKQEAEDLAILLRSGRLPGRVSIVSESVVVWDR